MGGLLGGDGMTETTAERFKRARKNLDVLVHFRLWGDSRRSMEVAKLLEARRMLGETEIPSECLSDWESRNLTAQWLLLEGEPIPPELAPWMAAALADALDGEQRAERVRKPGRPNVGGRDGEVQSLIFLVSLSPWRLKALRSPSAETRVGQHCADRIRHGKYGNPSNANALGESGCDAVGLAMGLSYRTCEAIWKRPDNPSLGSYRTITEN